MDCRDTADGAHDTVGRDKLVEFHLHSFKASVAAAKGVQLKVGHQIGETFCTSSQVEDEQ